MASTLTLAPALGHALVTAQGQPGGYDAIDDRAFWSVGKQEGVVGAGAFKVTQRAAGANMSVDVACNVGSCVVQGDTITGQGLYVVRAHPSVANLDIGTAHATLPRVDQVVVEIKDDEHDSSGLTRARVYVLAGTATSGATLTNRSGAAALPDSTMRLADVHVPATDTTISNSQIRDRRPWALGAYVRIVRNTGTYTLASSTPAVLDATNVSPRIECSGAPLRVSLRCLVTSTVAGDHAGIDLRLDGAQVDGGQRDQIVVDSVVGRSMPAVWTMTPAAGSHVIAPYMVRAGTGTLTFVAAAGNPLEFVVEEIVRPSEANNETTSG